MNMYRKAIASSIAIVMAVIVVVFAGLSGYLYISNSGLQSNLNIANSQITSLTSKNQILNNQITSLNQNISALEQEKTTLESQLTTAVNNASSLQTQLNQVNSQLSSLQTQVNTLNDVVALKSSTTEVSSQSFSTGTSGNVSVITFSANYSGYVVISDQSASDYANEGPSILDLFSSSIQNSYAGVYIPSYGFFNSFTRVGSSIAYPITPGTITVYLDTSDTTAQTATLTVTYYY